MLYAILRFGMRSAGVMAIHSIGIVPFCCLSFYSLHKEGSGPVETSIGLLLLTFIGSLWFDGVLYVHGCTEFAWRLVKGLYHGCVVAFFVNFTVPQYEKFLPAWNVGAEIRRELGAKSAGVRIRNSPHELTIHVDDPAFDDADLLKMAECANASGFRFRLHLVNSAVTYASVCRFGNGRQHVDIYLYGPRFGKEGLPELLKHRGSCDIVFVDGSLKKRDFRVPWWTKPPVKLDFNTEYGLPDLEY